MSIVTIKLPDVGEGIAEAELVEWNVKPGDNVTEDDILAAVMTDKTTVEIPSPVSGRVLWINGQIGEKLAVGGELVRIETGAQEAEEGRGGAAEHAAAQASSPVAAKQTERAAEAGRADAQPSRMSETKPLAAPAVRQQAREREVDLRNVHGTGPGGRILQADLEAYLSDAPVAAARVETPDAVRETKIIGLRRRIAERMANAKRRIPHITIVEEVDVTAVESLREQLNAERPEGLPKLTILPFLMMAVTRAVREQPAMNAHYDDEAEIFREYSAVHIGIATQTGAGLMVPVIRHCETRSVWDCASEVARLAEAARNATASREELSGSTITISSLGALGAIMTTPIINYPEVAIVGVNRMEIRPRWDGNGFVPRKMMNLSSSFDHRVIDGWDAAIFVKRLKALLEAPEALLADN